MLLLSDGTVIAANNPTTSFNNGVGSDWYRLTPDPNGHYVNGEWTRIASMNHERYAYASQVLTNGMVFVAGGEYPTGGAGGASAELYDPVANTWTLINPPPSLLDGTKLSPGFIPPQNQAFADAQSDVLPNGTVLVRPANPNGTNSTLIYDPRANTWSAGPNPNLALGEESWVKLPDGSILTIDPIITDAQGNSTNGFGTNSERFIPYLNQWIPDATVPVSLYTPLSGYFGETGPGFLLPNGKAFFLGGTGHTAIYTPSGSTNVGTWVAGPDIPGGLVSADAPAAMMPNGKILCAVAGGPSMKNGKPSFPSPTSFFEYDYTDGPTGSFTQVDGPTGTTDNIESQNCNMLVLPDGSVLYCHFEQNNLSYSSFGSQLYVYVPSDGVPVAAGKPVIRSITPNADGSFLLTGTGLTGISSGAAFGDDAQMDSNYPIIMFKDPPTGHVDYGRTFNWSDTGVMTGYEVETAHFTLPQGLVATTYEVSVSVNGIISDPVLFSFVAPSFLALCPGESATLKLVTAPNPNVVYGWQFNLHAIAGETNAQLNIVSAQTNQAGYYDLGYISGNEFIFSQLIPVAVGVWVVEQPPATNSTPICQPYSMTVHVRGKGTLAAQWFRGGNKMVADSRISFTSQPGDPGETLFSINFSETSYEDDATYIVRITDDCGQGSTLPFALRVTPNPPWVRIATDGPPSRASAAMCYDSDRHVMVLFGGTTGPVTAGGYPGAGGYLGDTWEFDGTNWTQHLPVTSPVGRYQANMVYDTFRHRTVLFGGLRYDGTYGIRFSPETWEWDGTNWTQVVTAHLPPWREWLYPYAACYDSARKEMLLFGLLSDPLWAYDGTDWSVRNPQGAGPGYTPGPLLAFDSNRGVAVLLGGSGGSLSHYPVLPLWEWDGKVWQERAQTGQQPWLNASGNALTYDTFRQECVLFGQAGGVVDGQETQFLYPAPDFDRYVWRWNGAQWQADPPTPTLGVSANQYHSMAFDSARNALVLFGGSDQKGNYDTNYTYEIVYKDAPTVLKQPTSQFATLGQDTQLTVVVGGAPVISYQWQKNGVNLTDGGSISGSTSNILQIAGVNSGDFGNYQLTMSNLCSSTTSQPIQLIVTSGRVSIGWGSATGGPLVIGWNGPGAVLENAPAPTGPWTDVQGATSPYSAIVNRQQQYFRVSN